MWNFSDERFIPIKISDKGLLKDLGLEIVDCKYVLSSSNWSHINYCVKLKLIYFDALVLAEFDWQTFHDKSLGVIKIGDKAYLFSLLLLMTNHIFYSFVWNKFLMKLNMSIKMIIFPWHLKILIVVWKSYFAKIVFESNVQSIMITCLVFLFKLLKNVVFFYMWLCKFLR